MGIIHLNPAPKRFTMPYSIFFANIRYTHLSRQVVLYCLPLLLGAIYTVFMWQKCIYSIHLIVSHPLNHCCLIYPAPPCRLAHTDLPTEIFSYNLDFFFCSYLFLPGHDNTPPMMTVFYFTVSHRGSISEREGPVRLYHCIRASGHPGVRRKGFPLPCRAYSSILPKAKSSPASSWMRLVRAGAWGWASGSRGAEAKSRPGT